MVGLWVARPGHQGSGPHCAAEPQLVEDALDFTDVSAPDSTACDVHEIFCRLAPSLQKPLKTARGGTSFYVKGSEEPLGVQLVGACLNVVLTFRHNFFYLRPSQGLEMKDGLVTNALQSWGEKEKNQ